MTIEINHLHKAYRQTFELKDIQLQIGTGLFGLLGPNGAGKSTLMNILSTILPMDKGKVTIYGFDLMKEEKKVRELLGFLPQHFHPPGQFTGREFLHYVASLKGITEKQEREAQVEKVLEQVNLINQANKKIKHFSGGMKRRLGIAQALLGDPKFLMFDEPTAGLDPSERLRFRNILDKLRNDRTILLSTHIISDIELSCDQVGIMNKGEILYQGTTEDLANQAKDVVWEMAVPSEDYDKIERQFRILASRKENDDVVIKILSKEMPFEKAYQVKPTIEDGYMAFIHGVIR